MENELNKRRMFNDNQKQLKQKHKCMLCLTAE